MDSGFNGIYVDTREPMKEFRDVLQYYLEHSKEKDKFPEIEYEALTYGDYQIIGKHHCMIVERKEYHDYCSSITDYLKERMEHIRLENEYSMLLVEGEPLRYNQHDIYVDVGKCEPQKSRSYQATTNFILSQQLNGSLYDHTKDYKETVLKLICYWRYLDSLPKTKISYHCDGWQKWLSMAPFVGKNLALKARVNYNSCFDALLDIDEWAKEKTIEGINRVWQIKGNEIS